MLVDLNGQIERITYFNQENGYTVAKVKVSGHRDLVTVVGNFMAPTPGEILRMKGEWANHRKFGEQYKMISYKTAVPATINGIGKYLGSGLIKGIGPVMARRIVNMFGEDTLDVIDNHADMLTQVQGIGKKRIAMIRDAWQEQKDIREVMLFLQTHGVSAGYAAKIFKHYGQDAIAVVMDNPYRLAMDIFGIGFVTADKIAEKLGFAKDSPVRIQAGIIFVLHQLADDGHVYYPYEPLLAECRKILDVEKEAIITAFGVIEADKKIVIEDLNNTLDEYIPNNKAVFLQKYYVCETAVAHRLTRLIHAPETIRQIDVDKAISWVQEKLGIALAERQITAVRSAIQNKVMVITGGPGTGKTTIINAILQIYRRLKVKILLAAPTGRAAKRMSEATGHEARTIHRLLEFSMSGNGFQRNSDRPLECDLLIVDEASMIDTILMHHLLKAVPLNATFLLVGDVNQLPSVGAGNVLGDIIESNTLPVVVLNEIFRQARQSLIIVNAHKINQGIIPKVRKPDPSDDFFFIREEDPESALSTILSLVTSRVPNRFGVDPFDDIQVLTPMHKGIAGAGNLNEKLQQALNPGGSGVVRGIREFRNRDKVMQIKNNYDKEVFNGDIGRIERIDMETQEMVICFDDRDITYDFSELDEIVLAYAISVHKSQGSEYPVVILPVLSQHYILLQRNLIYTAVTRGKKLVIMVGTQKALAMAVKNNTPRKRFTRLDQRLSF